MVKVAIIGMGRVGSALAFSLFFHPFVDEIHITDIDINKLQGELTDLHQASRMLVCDKSITCLPHILDMDKFDYIFICAGVARRDSTVTDEELLSINLPIVSKLIQNMPKDKVYIITNPAAKLGELLGVKYCGDKLDKFRETHHLNNGKWILDKKGFTNWGIVGEAWNVIQ
jgi:L-lactate dehydrogenase